MNDLSCRLTRQSPDLGRRSASARLTLPVETVEATEAAESACGWFDSSWDLRQGLAVSELPDSELAVAALWFSGPAFDRRSLPSGSPGAISVQWQ